MYIVILPQMEAFFLFVILWVVTLIYFSYGQAE